MANNCGAASAASIGCRCGAIRLTFSTARSVNAFECCCVDCYDKNLWSCHRAGVAPPTGLEAHGSGRPLLLRYFLNRLVLSGLPTQLRFNKLRADSKSTNMVSRCCDTLLCVDHTGYNGNVVLAFPEFCPLITGDRQPAPCFRVFATDWPSADYARLPPLPCMSRTSEGLQFSPDTSATRDAWQTAMVAFRTPPPDGVRGESFEQLLVASGGAVEVLNLPEGPNSARVRRSAARAARVSKLAAMVALGAAIVAMQRRAYS